MLPLEDAQARILSAQRPLTAESVALLDAAGRVVAAPVHAVRPSPPFPNSAMDGYAVRAEDTASAPCDLPVAFTVAAGAGAPPDLERGQAARIYTGAMLPPGANAVVMQEETERRDARVHLRAVVAPGQHVRVAGEDLTLDAPMLVRGQVVGPGDIAALASQGLAFLQVVRRPRVAIVPTGDELVEVGQPLGPGQIYNANSLGLAAQVLEAGGIPLRCPPAPDTAEGLRAALRAAADAADLVLTSGGVSVGELDLVRQALEAAGHIDFWRVAIKPGKPLAFGTLHGRSLIGLPGNPVSSYVCFELFARPAIRALLGVTRPHRERRRLPVWAPLRPQGSRRELVRARLRRRDGQLGVEPLAKQGSGQLASLLGVGALIDRAPEAPAAAAGDTVDAWMVGEEGPESP
jgi:molybdopterin molybdotransferase